MPPPVGELVPPALLYEINELEITTLLKLEMNIAPPELSGGLEPTAFPNCIVQ